ncbi:hypothetical protein G9A89_007934 [Geosiphon pyriformis]|nr:hypothetical protein G9A89_007934 [Geosiphon pyriformis]
MNNSWERVDIYYNLLEVQLLLENVNLQPTDIYNIQKKRPKNLHNKFKVAITPDTTTLKYHQSIYTRCKQRFNILDGIEVVKKSVYQYIENRINNYFFGNYNISEVRSNLYNNLVHYSQLETKDLNSETFATYFQELNFNIIEYCEEKYPVQPKYSFNFESETKTSNKDKQKVKQYSITTPNTPILPKTTAKYLQTSEQGTSVKLPLSITPFLISLLPRNPTQQQEPISTSANIIDYLQENESNHSESLESEETEPEPEEATENEEEMATAYIAKISEFTAGLKNKLIKKVHPHASADLATAIRYAKNYEMAMEEVNHTKLVNLAIGETSSAAEEKIDQLTKKVESYFTNQQQQHDATKTTLDHHPTTNLKIVTIVEFEDTKNKIARNYKETNKTGTPPIQQYQVLARKLVQHNQFTPQNQFQNNNNRINPNNQLVLRNSGQQRPNHYHTQPNEVAAPRSNPSNNTIPPAQIAQNANLLDIFPFEFKANESPFLLSNAAANEQKAITAMYTKATVERKPIRLILDSESAESIITYQLMQQLQKTVNRPAQTVIVTANGMKKTPVREIDNFPFTIDGITIPVKVLVIDALQYQALVRNNWLLKVNANLDWKTQKLKISYQGQYTIVPATCGTFNKQSEKAPVFEFEKEKEMPLTETYMAFESTSNWAEETEQEIFEESRG